MAKFQGGSPQSNPSNPYANGVGGNLSAGNMPDENNPSGSAPEAGNGGPGANPYSAASPGIVGAADSNVNYGLGANNPAPLGPNYAAMPGKYYTNPAVSSSGNPHNDGRLDDASDLTNYVDAGLSDVYGVRLSQGASGASPSAADASAIWSDEGYGTSGEGRS